MKKITLINFFSLTKSLILNHKIVCLFTCLHPGVILHSCIICIFFSDKQEQQQQRLEKLSLYLKNKRIELNLNKFEKSEFLLFSNNINYNTLLFSSWFMYINSI